MAQPDTYMLDRNPKESKRLDSQHELVRLLCHGHLVHPSIPQNEVQSIANVGTGTGVWLQQVAESFPGQKREFVGFDSSSLQFPTSNNHPDGARFAVHDMTQPFPKEYHGKFDLVHVRFLVFGLKQQDLKATIENLTEILRPGGYFQWQEADNADLWTTLSTPSIRHAISNIIREKVTHGLIVSMPTQIIKTMLSLSIPSTLNVGNAHATDSSTKINPVSWTNDLLRVLMVDTYSSHKPPSPDIQAYRGSTGFSYYKTLLHTSAVRKRAMAVDEQNTSEDKSQLIKEAEENEHLMTAIESEITGIVSWDATLNWIVARKAIIVDRDQDWMSASHPTAKRVV